MQIITAEPDISNTLCYFGRGLLTDWHGWHGWYVLQVIPQETLRPMDQGKVAAAIRANLQGLDGAVLWHEHGPSLAIFHAKQGFNRQVFHENLSENLGVGTDSLSLLLFSVTENLEDILLVLSRHTGAGLRSKDPLDLPMPDFAHSVSHFHELIELWKRVEASKQGRKEPHLMLVDDDALTRHIIARTLKNDYALLTATNTAEAIRKHILFAPDIIFLDIQLPDHDGFAFLQHVRQHDPNCRIIMFSGNNYFENRLKAFACGAAGFIAKPFHRDAFEHYIEAWKKPASGGYFAKRTVLS